MIVIVLEAVIGPILAVAATVAVLSIPYRLHVRRFNDRVARDLLDDWQGQLALAEPAGRERMAAAPPPSVLTAMTALSSPGPAGLVHGWTEAPMTNPSR